MTDAGGNTPADTSEGVARWQLKVRAHEAFDPLWHHHLLTRNQAYAWLAKQLDVPKSKAHISTMTNKQLGWLIRRAPRHYRKLASARDKLKGVYDVTNRRARPKRKSNRPPRPAR